MRPWYKRYPSIIIAIILALVLGSWYGYRAYQDARIAAMPLEQIEPSTITFLALSRKSGYRVIITNGQPFVIEVDPHEQFDAPEANAGGGGQRKRVPLDELLKAMTGDPKGLGALLVSLRESRVNPDDEYEYVQATVPVTYDVLGRQTTVNASLRIPVDKGSEVLTDPEARKRWEASLKGSLPIDQVKQLVENSEVVLTDKHLVEGWWSKMPPHPLLGELYSIHFQLNEKGRQRLLQQTSKHRGEQIIIFANAIPVANPIIKQQLNTHRLDIPNVTNIEMVEQLVEGLKQAGIKVSGP